MLDREKIDKTIANTDVRSLLSSYDFESITDNGEEIRACCPFDTHTKNKLTFSINCITGLWSCHACSISGDIPELIKKLDNVTFPDAMKKLTELSGDNYCPATKTTSKHGFTKEQILEQSSPLTGSHSYCTEKCIEPCEDLLHWKRYNNIVVLLKNIKGSTQAIQTIRPDGTKNYHGQCKGAFYQLGDFKDGDEIIFTEGYATAKTIYVSHNTRICTISFGAAFNMTHVVDAFKAKYPNIEPLVYLDINDAAYKQARKLNPAHNCKFFIPSFEGLEDKNPKTHKDGKLKKMDDFNDLKSKCGVSFEKVPAHIKEVTLDDISINKKTTTDETIKVESMSSSSLNTDLELDVINYLSHKSFNDVVDEGFEPDEFVPELFSGHQVKKGKEQISIHRKIVGIIREFWGEDKQFTITDISLKADKYTDEIHKILKSPDSVILDKQQIKDRLKRLKENLKRSKIEGLIRDHKKGNLSSEDLPDKLNNVLLATNTQIGGIKSDFHHEEELIRHEEEDNNYIATGFKDMDLLFKGGVRPGRVFVYQGEAGAGKSTFMLQQRDYFAQNEIPVLYIANEQTRGDLYLISKARIKLDIKDEDENTSNALLNNFAHEKYMKASKNIFTIDIKDIEDQELESLTLTRLKLKIREVIRQAKNKPKPVVFIDPFQRLIIGDSKLDEIEYNRINALIKGIKRIAVTLGVTIFVASDVTKDHKNNTSGEGAGRGTYMIQHQADAVLTFKTSETCPFNAIYQFPMPECDEKLTGPQKVIQQAVKDTKKKKDEKCDFMFKNEHRVTKKYKLSSNSEKWVALVCSKNRYFIKFHPLFIFEGGKRFKEVPIWSTIISPGE